MVLNKKLARIRRATRTRKKMKELGVIRLVIHRTPRHIYAQVISSSCGDEVIVAASTVEKVIVEKIKNTGNKNTGNKEAAEAVGKVIAKRTLAKGIKVVSFDRSGFQYHGRVQALAEAAREAGLQF